MSEPATKEDLAKAVAELRAEMATKRDVALLKEELTEEFRVAVRIMDENFQRYFSVVDDKYKDLPEKHKKLREDLDNLASEVRSLAVR